MTALMTESQSTSAAPSLVADPKRPVTAVVNFTERLDGDLIAQPSKNYTTRWLLAGGLGGGVNTVEGLATSDDARAMVHGLRCLGASIDLEDQVGPGGTPSRRATVRGIAGRPQLSQLALDAGEVCVGNAGAVLRLLLGTGALLPEVKFTTDHPNSLGKRPQRELLDALRQLGCESDSGEDGRLPIILRGGTLRGGQVRVSGARSSQFLSSLLFLAPLLPEPLEIFVDGGLVSQPAVHQTLETLRTAGIAVEAAPDLLHFRFAAPQAYASNVTYRVNGDWPGSAALLAAAAVVPSSVRVHSLFADSQGEKACQQVLAGYGTRIEPLVSYKPKLHQVGVEVTGGNHLESVDFDGDTLTDAVLAMMGPACFAAGRTRIFNVHNLRLKECDRISEPLAELRKIGVHCWEGHQVGDSDPDAILIQGNPDGYQGGITVDGRGDHRVIMLLTIVGLRCRQGLRISGAHHIAKSYPTFFADMAKLGARVELVPAEASE